MTSLISTVCLVTVRVSPAAASGGRHANGLSAPHAHHQTPFLSSVEGKASNRASRNEPNYVCGSGLPRVGRPHLDRTSGRELGRVRGTACLGQGRA